MKFLLVLLLFPAMVFAQTAAQDTSFYWGTDRVRSISFDDTLRKIYRTETYYFDGKKQSECVYMNGKDFFLNCWLPDGKQILTNGNGEWIYSGTDSTIYTVKDSIYNGPAQSYYKFFTFKTPWKLWATGNYENGKRTGEWTFRDSSGAKNIVLNFENGMAKGPCEFYYSYTNIRSDSGYLDDCKRIGRWKKFDEKGNLTGEYEYKDGQKMGACTLYYPNGKIKAKGQYKQVSRRRILHVEDPNNPNHFLYTRFRYTDIPARTGVWYFYAENGTLVKKKKYRHRVEEQDYCGQIW